LQRSTGINCVASRIGAGILPQNPCRDPSLKTFGVRQLAAAFESSVPSFYLQKDRERETFEAAASCRSPKDAYFLSA
jgi:hypothetical protein